MLVRVKSIDQLFQSTSAITFRVSELLETNAMAHSANIGVAMSRGGSAKRRDEKRTK
jgi:hypothetical protein